MPAYVYTCPCGITEEEFRTIKENTDPPTCLCGCEMKRDYAAECMGGRVTGAFEKPIDMYSIALNPSEIADFKRKCPDVEVPTSGPMMGVPVVRNRSQKLKALKAMGFEEKN